MRFPPIEHPAGPDRSPRFERLTPPGPGAIAVIALAGAGAGELASALFGRGVPAGRLGVGWLRFAGERIDQAVLRAGAHGCELAVHGGAGVVGRVEAALRALGAVPGDTRHGARALDEAAQAVERALTERALDVALHQCTGAFDAALLELATAGEEVARARLDELAGAAVLGRALFAPRRVVLVGPNGAGKSSLLNALCGAERALVGEGTGTTRDWLEEQAHREGMPIVAVDTPADPTVVRGALDRADVVVRLGLRGEPPAWPPREWCPLAWWVDLPGGSVDARAEALWGALLAPTAGERERGFSRAVPVHPAQWALIEDLCAAPERRVELIASYRAGTAADWAEEPAGIA